MKRMNVEKYLIYCHECKKTVSKHFWTIWVRQEHSRIRTTYLVFLGSNIAVISTWNIYFQTIKSIYIKSLLLNKKGTCNVPYDVIESLAATFLPDIQAFFESEEGKKEFDEWKDQQKLKEALDYMNSNHMFTIE